MPEYLDDENMENLCDECQWKMHFPNCTYKADIKFANTVAGHVVKCSHFRKIPNE